MTRERTPPNMARAATLILLIAVLISGCTSANTTRTTRAVPRTPDEAVEKCFSGWDGDHRDFKKQVEAQLNDPDSMQVHGTYYNGSEDISDGTMLIRMDYGARNRLGGMVRTDAFAEMNIRTCAVTIIDYGG